ncbi:monovalent cation/H+ antiporter complex subunit F [Williamsia muralis]|uniref:monovalent cation/H+ antiporter complex subunit F n=1 Tax=Williamsia marianensis TaxID=85044 RepID=UPI00381CE450
MNVVWMIAAGLLLTASVLTTARILIGPNTLDRLVALDTGVAMAMCSLAVWAAYSMDSTVVSGLVALSLLSFVGTVAVARFRVRDNEVQR